MVKGWQLQDTMSMKKYLSLTKILKCGFNTGVKLGDAGEIFSFPHG
jgi:hypothetical protein